MTTPHSDPWTDPCSACGFRHAGPEHPGVSLPLPGTALPTLPAGLGYDLRTDAPRLTREQSLAKMLGCDPANVPPLRGHLRRAA